MTLARTLDWDNPMLREMVINVDYMKNNKLIFTCTTFPGFIGLLTAQKHKEYAVCVNFRIEVDEDENESESDSFRWPIGLLVRHSLESCSSYSSAVTLLSSAPLLAPCYFIVIGAAPSEGVQITRSCDDCLQPKVLDMSKQTLSTCMNSQIQSSENSSWWNVFSSWWNSSSFKSRTNGGDRKQSSQSHQVMSTSPYLVQANMDHWIKAKKLDFFCSLPRTTLVHQHATRLLSNNANKTSSKSSKANKSSSSSSSSSASSSSSITSTSSLCISSSLLCTLLGLYPIWDDDTIHATVCCPAESKFDSFIDHPDHDDESEYQAPKRRNRAQGGGNKYGSRSIQTHTKSLNVNHKQKKQKRK